MRRATAAVALLLLGVSCGGDAKTAKERPRSAATIKIAEPEAGETVSGKTFTVRLDLGGGRIVDVVSQDLTPDEGHVHVSIDGRIISQTFGLTEKVKVPDSEGRHLLQAEFVAKDHGPFMPRVLDAVPFTVR